MKFTRYYLLFRQYLENEVSFGKKRPISILNDRKVQSYLYVGPVNILS